MSEGIGWALKMMIVNIIVRPCFIYSFLFRASKSMNKEINRVLRSSHYFPPLPRCSFSHDFSWSKGSRRCFQAINIIPFSVFWLSPELFSVSLEYLNRKVRRGHITSTSSFQESIISFLSHFQKPRTSHSFCISVLIVTVTWKMKLNNL